MRNRRSIVLAALLVLVSIACDETNGCEEALKQNNRLTDDICAPEPWHSTPFCSTCVHAGYYSTTGAADCKCTLLAFDQPVCTYPSDDEAKSEIRAAIQWANDTCPSFTLGRTDAGAGGEGP